MLEICGIRTNFHSHRKRPQHSIWKQRDKNIRVKTSSGSYIYTRRVLCMACQRELYMPPHITDFVEITKRSHAYKVFLVFLIYTKYKHRYKSAYSSLSKLCIIHSNSTRWSIVSRKPKVHQHAKKTTVCVSRSILLWSSSSRHCFFVVSRVSESN